MFFVFGQDRTVFILKEAAAVIYYLTIIYIIIQSDDYFGIYIIIYENVNNFLKSYFPENTVTCSNCSFIHITN